jgi:hypothetical protein
MNRSHLKECDLTTEGLIKHIKEREGRVKTTKESFKDLKMMRNLTDMGETGAIKEMAEHRE